MTERVIDGFIVRATTEPEEDGALFYEPAFRVRKVGSSDEHHQPWFAVSQNVEERSKQEALLLAERQLEVFTEVTWAGDDWNLHE